MKRSKYSAIKTVVDGITFASKREAAHYIGLKMLERAGEIQNLQLQPRFKCEIGGQLVCTYVGDFAYFTAKGRVIEDVKGMKTPIYRLKKKLVEALYPGLKIVEV